MTPSGVRWRIISIGRDANTPESALVQRYAARMQPKLDLLTLTDGIGSAAEIKRREAEAILKRLKPDEFVVTLDQAGDAPDSIRLATLLTGWREQSHALAFVIGGAEGLDRGVIDRAGATLSLGRLTLPHLLARVVLAEQLYRAQCILAGHPYHRSGRP